MCLLTLRSLICFIITLSKYMLEVKMDEKEVNSNLAEILTELRKDKGWSQQQVADLVGIGRRTIGDYETGRTQPDPYMLVKLAEIFDVNIDYLVGSTRIRTPWSTMTNPQAIRILSMLKKLSSKDLNAIFVLVESLSKISDEKTRNDS